MEKFFDKNASTIYVPLTEIIDKETYLKVLDLVISVKETNVVDKVLKNKPTQRIVVLIDVFENGGKDDYSQEVFNLLSTIRDQLYTVITGGAGKYAALIFLLAKKSRRYMLPYTTLCIWKSMLPLLKNFWHDKEFQNLYIPEGSEALEIQLPNDKNVADDLFSVYFANSIDKLF